MALTESGKLLEDIFDVLAKNTNHITLDEFREKWDFEIDYTHHTLTFWKEEDNELEDEGDITYFKLILDN